MEIALRTFYHVPVVGWLAKDAAKGAPDAIYYFLMNIAFLYAALVYLMGYPFLIVTLLAASALTLTTIVALTAADMIANSVRVRRNGSKPRKK